MILFRTEGSSVFESNPRTYNVEDYSTPKINKKDIDRYISQKIREEINNCQNRELISYSKSLATCLLKYNSFADNELHIYDVKNCVNYIKYISPHNNLKCRDYSIQDRKKQNPLFNGDGTIELLHFVIDVSDNESVDEYLKIYTGIGKKVYASPEKDHEVVVMNPEHDLVINQYLSSVYILYALQLRYHFLNNDVIRCSIIKELSNMEEYRFLDCPNERKAFIFLVQYLYTNWCYEYQISKGIYNYKKDEEIIHTYYDPIWQFQDIIASDDFDISYYLSTYNDNVISNLFWEYCRIFLDNR